MPDGIQWTDNIIDSIVSSLAANATHTEIAKACKCSLSALRKIIKDLNLQQKAAEEREDMISELGIDRYFYLREMKGMYHEAREVAAFGDARGCLNDLAKATGIIETKQQLQVSGKLQFSSIMAEVCDLEMSKPLVDIAEG